MKTPRILPSILALALLGSVLSLTACASKPDQVNSKGDNVSATGAVTITPPPRSQVPSSQPPAQTPKVENPLDNKATYSNGRFGFIIEVPVGWSAPKESGQGSTVTTIGPGGVKVEIAGEANPQALADGTAYCKAEQAKLNAEGYSQTISITPKDNHCSLQMANDSQGVYRSVYVGPAVLNVMKASYPVKNTAGLEAVKKISASFLPGSLEEAR